jgi:hypothetical protein
MFDNKTVSVEAASANEETAAVTQKTPKRKW